MKNASDEKTIESEIAFLSRKILELNKRFMESEKAKSRFLSLVGSELNNPMTVLLGMISHLRIEHDEKNENIFHTLYKELLSLDFKIKNIFTAAQIEGGNLDITHALCSPVEIVNEVIESLRYLIKEKNVQITIINLIDDKIVSDPHIIYIIAKNLIANACIYGVENGIVEITLSKNDSMFSIAVKDQGDGPCVDYKPEVFTRFADGPEGEHGLGIGLSLVREICAQLEGNVDYTVEDGFVTFIATMLLDETVIDSQAYGSDEFLFESFDNAIEL